MAALDNQSLTQTKGRTIISDYDYKKPGVFAGYWVIYALLILGTLTTIIPLIWAFFSGFKGEKELFQIPPHFFPSVWDPVNFKEAWKQINFLRYFWNTFVLAFQCWAVSIAVSALAGYALSKLKPLGSKIILMMFLSTLMVPFTSTLIPTYLLIRDIRLHVPEGLLNLLGTYWPIYLPAGVNAFAIFLFKGFFDGIPNDLIDAGRIDGAGDWRIFWQIVMPLSKPIIAVLSIFSFMGTWNSFLWPLIVLDNEYTYPIMVKLYSFQLISSATQSVILAALFIACLPPIVLFIFFQKHIIRGITLTGLKG
jgi:multiple sugar transport system permease protein